MSALYPVICSSQPAESGVFYRRLFGFEPTFESDWYVSLASPDLRQQIAFIDYQHDSIPQGASREPGGVLITVEVDDVDAMYSRVVDLDLETVLGVCEEPWGWRHFIIRDPHGLLVDVYKDILPKDILPKDEDAADPTTIGLIETA